ncbi:Atxe2 family lasso peptide isopeptidase [Sphingomonas sp. BIUV-7]|uniref:Atxe2 family lasso peptide isopeptidase n=2 Tax=Sphingomonas natans TaxID=3063330 RepID=A0ABT8YEU0_9SPHN|nr:Atxe2 family lasso peptide isopeptidase [Sphingomonas sp. BIUV-7]MDO6416100.1 Atxe2 family lasso peptide isopeptidase [Sphingomonas sp. BIUV-7]
MLDLVRLRDIGFPDPSITGGPSPLAVAPDGRSYAFVINRADPETNGYCRALVVGSLEAGRRLRIVDQGGTLITLTDVQRELFVPGGFPAVVTPTWSPDGQWIAYLRRDDGVTRAWRVRADGKVAVAVTRGPDDVETVRWSGDGHALLFTTRPGIRTEQQSIDREARSGWLYDGRVVTYSGARPQIRESVAPLVWFSADVATGIVTRLDGPGAASAKNSVAELYRTPEAIAQDGRRAWTDHGARSPQSPTELHLSDIHGKAIPCTAAICSGGGIIGLWWSPSGNALWALRREGWDRGDMALYHWRVGAGAPRRALRTQDVLVGCVPAGRHLLCVREGTRSPRHIVLIDPETGRSETVFDANPEFASIALPRVQRLRWTNDRGFEAWGDLVLPADYRRGTKLPLVIVQYHSDGFLRGGTGDEYPIFAFAARGFAVLSVERPAFASSALPDLKTYDEINAADYKDWAERRSLLSSLVTGVRQVIAMGVADPTRIGITGLSDGSTTVRFALINTRLFAASSISTCCLEPKTVMTYGGIAWADYNRRMGFPLAIEDNPTFWKPMSLAQNAKDIDVPLLMQMDDDEYLIGLEAFEALREYRKPVEMYVFPHEYHAKWQPIHRLAIYERNLDWFDYWLRGHRDADAAKDNQYRRWDALRVLRDEARIKRPGQAPLACSQASTSTSCMIRP